MKSPDATTPESVFEDLLVEWRHSETQIIGEFGVNDLAEHEEADRAMEAWRERFRAAMRGEGS